MRSPTRLVGERGAGTVLALGLVAAVVGVLLIMFSVTNRFLEQARLSSLADRAAIAGADALRGLLAGYPCKEAGFLVNREGASMVSCTISSMDVLVEIRRGEFTAKSRAGEPD